MTKGLCAVGRFIEDKLEDHLEKCAKCNREPPEKKVKQR
jgi:hypothetical protein